MGLDVFFGSRSDLGDQHQNRLIFLWRALKDTPNPFHTRKPTATELNFEVNRIKLYPDGKTHILAFNYVIFKVYVVFE